MRPRQKIVTVGIIIFLLSFSAFAYSFGASKLSPKRPTIQREVIKEAPVKKKTKKPVLKKSAEKTKKQPMPQMKLQKDPRTKTPAFSPSLVRPSAPGNSGGGGSSGGGSSVGGSGGVPVTPPGASGTPTSPPAAAAPVPVQAQVKPSSALQKNNGKNENGTSTDSGTSTLPAAPVGTTTETVSMPAPASAGTSSVPTAPPALPAPTTVTRTEPLILQGDEILEINNARYTMRNKITLRGRSKLIIKNSTFEHRHDYSFQYILDAYDDAQVIVENSEIQSSDWLNWNFYNRAALTLTNVTSPKSNIWHAFLDDASVTTRNAVFRGTIASQVKADLKDASDLFVEMVFPPDAVVDESLPQDLTNFTFPNENDRGINFSLKIQNGHASNWGITVRSRSSVTIRDADHLTATVAFDEGWQNATITMDGLKKKRYTDQTWDLQGTTLRLINVLTNDWSPIVGTGNTLILKNSELADNAFSWGNGKVILENSTASFLRAKEQVEMTVRDSTITGDVLAQDNGKITLINTTVRGKTVEEGSGKVIIQRQ